MSDVIDHGRGNYRLSDNDAWVERIKKQRERRKGRGCAVYRHFDKDGVLLYVGMSVCPIKRQEQHEDWFDWYGQVATITIEWLPSQSAASEAEKRAIQTENPKHNVRGRRA